MVVIKFCEIFESCLSGLKDREFEKRMAASKDFLRAVDKEFVIHAQYGLCHVFVDKLDGSAHCVASKDDLISCYEDKLVKNKAGRVVYKKLLGAAPGGLCELCHLTGAKTLDHYLPKACYPSLAISPLNLIPACRDCNTTKQTSVALSNVDTTLHPLLDHNTYKKRWLQAKLNEAEKSFSFSAADGHSYVVIKRINNHLAVHGIAAFYSIRAAVIAAEISISIMKYRTIKASDVRSEIELQWQNINEVCSKTNFKTHALKLAVLGALLDSPWYVSGGHRDFLYG